MIDRSQDANINMARKTASGHAIQMILIDLFSEMKVFWIYPEFRIFTKHRPYVPVLYSENQSFPRQNPDFLRIFKKNNVTTFMFMP